MNLIRVLESTTVRPATETPRHRLWLSSFDLLSEESHTPTLLFYRQPTGATTMSSSISHSFFDINRLKEYLAKVLVSFYPLAGRLARDENNRVEIDCNGEGVLFVVAESSTSLDEFGELVPSKKLFLQLVPQVDRTRGISSFPLYLAQITRFKCGAVCLCTAFHHFVVDGASAFHFTNSWSELCRGNDKITAEPFLDRTLLRPRNPPTPSFSHIEYHSPPSYDTDQESQSPNPPCVTYLFTVSPDQLARLKAQAPGYTTYEVLAGHIWRSTCKARCVPPYQQSKLHIAVNVRPRCRPPLPTTYFGCPQGTAAPIGTVGELVERPLKYAAGLIHDALERVAGEYVKSALDCLALHPDVESLRRGSHLYKGANLRVTSWMTMGIYSCDFGWGRPFFMGRGIIPSEGQAYVIPNASGDGGYTLPVCLQPHHIDNLKTFFYDFICQDKTLAKM